MHKYKSKNEYLDNDKKAFYSKRTQTYTWRDIPTSAHATARTMFVAECKWSSLIDNYARENISAVSAEKEK